MATAEQLAWLEAAAKAAKSGGHVWPAMAACEAAVESTWGASELAREDNNLFGCKQHVHPVYETVHIPTREFIGQKWITEDAAWVKYPTVAACFADRIATLRTMATTYPHYALALTAETPEEYVTEVSRSWSTDPERAAKCMEIYQAHQAGIAAAIAAEPQSAPAERN